MSTEFWYAKELGDGVAALHPTNQIQDQFVKYTLAETVRRGAYPSEMAIFSKYDSHKNVVTMYFSPGAMQFAQTVGAAPCERPGRKDLGLLAGDASVLEKLFSD